MDGNGRWAKRRMMPRSVGHTRGAKNVEVICEAAYDLGIKYLTVYAFSTENWSRPADEVKTLMKLFSRYLKSYRKKAMANNMRVRIIGDRTGLSEEMNEDIRRVEEETAGNTGLQFQIAINYGGRDEILRAVRRLKGTPAAWTIDDISRLLDTGGIPDPDLIIRPGGEYRLSNFLIWQSAYAEFYFTDVLWPDFSPEELKHAVTFYAGRDRRYGGV